jgi:hypothetical protein
MRLPEECNGKPVYKMEGAAYVLFQPIDEPYWMVGSADRITDCDASGWVSSSAGSCSLSPDGAGCAGLWRANTDDCGGDSTWCDAPTLTVTAS